MELIVFAAASLTETLTAIGEIYSAENPGVTFSFNFDSSGTLKTQIQEGADCDLFLSAGQKQMNQLDITASADVNTDGLDFVDPSTRVDLLENKVVLCVPEGSDKGIDSFDTLAEHLKAEDILFCMGNSDVPVGQYTQKILAYYALDEEALAAAGVITYGSNVKEVTTQITEASVDAGVVYCTDAYSAGLTPVDEATKEMCGQVIYPAAVLNVLIPLPTVVANTVIVPLILHYAYGLPDALPYLFLTVGLGEVLSAWVLGLLLLRVLKKVLPGIHRRQS